MTTFPMEFPGSAEEQRVNLRSHVFGGLDGRCYECDCRPYGSTARWPCGADVPRVSR